MGERGRGISRRDLLKAAMAGAFSASGALSFLPGAAGAERAGARRVLVLGIDGMSPVLLKRYVAEGRMPNFAGLMKNGGFRELRSSLPPQSPVAWSNFITGMNPGRHGIYDFIHRDPATLKPFLSTSRVTTGKTIPVGGWEFPLGGGAVELLRKGPISAHILARAHRPCRMALVRTQ